MKKAEGDLGKGYTKLGTLHGGVGWAAVERDREMKARGDRASIEKVSAPEDTAARKGYTKP